VPRKRELQEVDYRLIREYAGGDEYRLIFATRLNELLFDKGYSGKAFADKIGTSTASIFAYTHGTRDPTSPMIITLAKALDVSADYLLGITETPSDDPVNIEISKVLGLNDSSIEVLKRDAAKVAKRKSDDSVTLSCDDAFASPCNTINTLLKQFFDAEKDSVLELLGKFLNQRSIDDKSAFFQLAFYELDDSKEKDMSDYCVDLDITQSTRLKGNVVPGYEKIGGNTFLTMRMAKLQEALYALQRKIEKKSSKMIGLTRREKAERKECLDALEESRRPERQALWDEIMASSSEDKE